MKKAFPLVLVVAVACTTDIGPTVATTDDTDVVTLEKGRKGVPGDLAYVFEPQRFEFDRRYLPGTLKEFGEFNTETVHRYCQLNSYEDRDGDDFVEVGPSGTYRKEHLNENDAIVLVGHRPTRTVTHIGRAIWQADVWYDAQTEGQTLSGGSHAQGVVFPVQGDPALQAQVDSVLFWLHEAESIKGAYPNGNMGPGIDLLNDPLGPIPAAPEFQDAGFAVGSEARVVAAIDALLGAYEARDGLVGVNCDADWVGALDSNPATPITIRSLEVILEKTWPHTLKKLFD